VYLLAAHMDGSFGVAAAVAWSHMVVDGSSFSMWDEAEEGTQTMPTQANNKARSYTWLMCRNHGPWWSNPLAQCFRIGGAEYISFHTCEQVPIRVEQQRSRKKEEHSSCFMCAGATRAKLCKAGGG
jgi:hypothetical protein